MVIVFKCCFCILIVKFVVYFSLYMIWVMFVGLELEGFLLYQEGVNCKLVLLWQGESCMVFEVYFVLDGLVEKVYVVCIYIVCVYWLDVLELDIDFVVYGDEGFVICWV